MTEAVAFVLCLLTDSVSYEQAFAVGASLGENIERLRHLISLKWYTVGENKSTLQWLHCHSTSFECDCANDMYKVAGVWNGQRKNKRHLWLGFTSKLEPKQSPPSINFLKKSVSEQFACSRMFQECKTRNYRTPLVVTKKLSNSFRYNEIASYAISVYSMFLSPDHISQRIIQGTPVFA